MSFKFRLPEIPDFVIYAWKILKMVLLIVIMPVSLFLLEGNVDNMAYFGYFIVIIGIIFIYSYGIFSRSTFTLADYVAVYELSRASSISLSLLIDPSDHRKETRFYKTMVVLSTIIYFESLEIIISVLSTHFYYIPVLSFLTDYVMIIWLISIILFLFEGRSSYSSMFESSLKPDRFLQCVNQFGSVYTRVDIDPMIRKIYWKYLLIVPKKWNVAKL